MGFINVIMSTGFSQHLYWDLWLLFGSICMFTVGVIFFICFLLFSLCLPVSLLPFPFSQFLILSFCHSHSHLLVIIMLRCLHSSVPICKVLQFSPPSQSGTIVHVSCNVHISAVSMDFVILPFLWPHQPFVV